MFFKLQHIGIILTSVFDTGNTSDFTMASKDFNKRVKTSEPGLSFLLPINKQKEGCTFKHTSTFRGKNIHL